MTKEDFIHVCDAPDCPAAHLRTQEDWEKFQKEHPIPPMTDEELRKELDAACEEAIKRHMARMTPEQKKALLKKAEEKSND